VTFTERITSAEVHEHDVLDRLIADGVPACPFGQGQISEAVRTELVRTHSPIRWTPDIIAVLAPLAYWIDAKCGRLDKPNYTIEVEALRGHRALECAGFATVIVWPDFRWNHARDLIPDDLVVGSNLSRNGSGTPFWLVKKHLSRPWDQLFPGSLVRRPVL
jgi:hypothetical protein